MCVCGGGGIVLAKQILALFILLDGPSLHLHSILLALCIFAGSCMPAHILQGLSSSRKECVKPAGQLCGLQSWLQEREWASAH